MKSKKLLRLLCLLMVLSLIAAACGDDDDDDTSAGGQTTETTAGDGEGGGDPEPTAGFDGTTIKVGVLTPLTERVAVIGKPLTAGNKAWFDHVNEQGGIGGKYKIEMVTQDTRYDPPTAVQLYNGMKNDVVMIAQLLGTPVVNAVLPQLKTDKIVAQPASLDSFWVREQQLLPVGAPYQIQAINAVDYWWNEAGGEGKTVCTMIQDDPYGEAGQEGVDFAAEELGFDVAATAKFKVTDQDFTAQINQLKGANCEMVFGVVTAASLSGIMTSAVQNDFQTQWILQSPSWLGVFAKTPLAPYLQKNVWLVSEGAPWGDTSAPGMAEMVEIHDKFSADVPPGDQYWGFGYVAARAVTEVLERAVEMGDLSREGIIEAMNSIEEFDHGGISGTYGWGAPADRKPPTKNSIYKIDPAGVDGRAPVVANYEASFAKDFEFGE